MEMDTNSKEMSTNDLMIADLSKAQHEVSIAQKKNKRLQDELKSWKEKAVGLENNLKQEKRNNENNIMHLGFKMLQFESQLRKEQREIENRFIEKDNQIKLLEDVINALHTRIKKNSLCYNCFVTKHNAPEHSLNPDSYSIKFPLDMDFSDHKSTNHNSQESRSRNMSLPLNVQSPHESQKSINEFHFHHMLSPVPEELENSFLDHTRRVNKEETIEECDEEDEEAGEMLEEANIDQGITNGGNESEIQVTTERNQEQEKGDLISNYIKIPDEEGKKIAYEGINQNLCGLTEENEKENSNDVNNSDECENAGSFGVNDFGSTQENLEESKVNVENEFEINSEINCLLVDLIHRVEQFMSHNQVISKESTNSDTAESEDLIKHPNQVPEILEKENIDRTPLSPKSEAVVAELQRAIFEASMELEKKNDLVKMGTSEEDVEVKTIEPNVNDNAEIKESKNLDSINSIIECRENSEVSVNITDIDLELFDDGSVPKLEQELFNEGDKDQLSMNCKAKETAAEGSGSDTLTDYDVIELD